MLELNDNWLRKDTKLDATYYGYSSNVASKDVDKTWSIRKVSITDTVESVLWSDNRIFNYIARWVDRTDNFVQPNQSLGLTSSTYFDQNQAIITSTWNQLTGVNIYKIAITDQNNDLYSIHSSIVQNGYDREPITSRFENNYFYEFRGKTEMTYYIKVIAENTAGSTSSTITVET
jgi:hypothetical protein